MVSGTFREMVAACLPTRFQQVAVCVGNPAAISAAARGGCSGIISVTLCVGADKIGQKSDKSDRSDKSDKSDPVR